MSGKRRYYVSTRAIKLTDHYYRVNVSFKEGKPWCCDWQQDLHKMYDFIGRFLVHRQDLSTWCIERKDGEVLAGDHLENTCKLYQ